ncbi:hypothetical protein HAX54_035811 [Datura stramonium]|uniref:Uncharacterized protein n=1 Tax=Datura stramonium TaxID=4076 RepID=A0ABS8RM40_DATST|nr:hypothetical protein [Datura stramonium]
MRFTQIGISNGRSRIDFRSSKDRHYLLGVNDGEDVWEDCLVLEDKKAESVLFLHLVFLRPIQCQISRMFPKLSPSSAMFATGPYAHETQLVSPPVFSNFTTEPSTAPFTPPPELAHLTTPSSQMCPSLGFLSSSLNGHPGCLSSSCTEKELPPVDPSIPSSRSNFYIIWILFKDLRLTSAASTSTDHTSPKHSMDVFKQIEPANHAMSDDEGIFSKMGTLRLSRKYDHGLSSSDAEIVGEEEV